MTVKKSFQRFYNGAGFVRITGTAIIIPHVPAGDVSWKVSCNQELRFKFYSWNFISFFHGNSPLRKIYTLFVVWPFPGCSLLTAFYGFINLIRSSDQKFRSEVPIRSPDQKSWSEVLISSSDYRLIFTPIPEYSEFPPFGLSWHFVSEFLMFGSGSFRCFVRIK